MDTMTLTLNHASVPAVLYGSPSPQVWLCLHGKATNKGLHRATVRYVAAPAQAAAAERIIVSFGRVRGCLLKHN